MIATVMVLQALEGLSDREAISALRRDIAWKVACGLRLDDEGFHPTVLVYWRARLRTSDRPRRKVAASELHLVDLVIYGSAAVNHEGARVGKGGGFSDLEVAFLIEAGVLRPDTVLATTVHALQVLDEPLPETTHDFRVDLIVTPDEVIWCDKPRRPPGILLGPPGPRQDRQRSSVGRPGSPTLRNHDVRKLLSGWAVVGSPLRKGIDQWTKPWPSDDLMAKGMLRNIRAGETFIVWDDNGAPAAIITIDHWANPDLWTPRKQRI